MRYKCIDEVSAEVARYILKLAKTEGFGIYDEKTHDVSKALQINSYNLPYILKSADDFEFAYRQLGENGYIKTVFASYVPILDNGQATDYESEEHHFHFIIINIDGLKEYLDNLVKLYPKRQIPIIKLKALELMAKKIGELDSGNGLVEFFKNNGVDSQLIIYPNTKWKMIYDIFEYLSFSGKKEDNNLLFKLIEEVGHPLMFNGDKKKAEEIQDFFTGCMEYDGYCVYRGKVVKTTEELLEMIEKRKLNREAATNLAFSDLLSSEFFGGRQAVRREIKTEVPVEKSTPINVVIHNTNQIQTAEVPKATKDKLGTNNLAGADIKFDDNGASIKINNQIVSLPPYKNEHFFCREMFKHLMKEPIDWSIIYKTMNGEVDNQEKNKRTVFDTMYAINKRIEETINTKDKLFVWNEKTVARQF